MIWKLEIIEEREIIRYYTAKGNLYKIYQAEMEAGDDKSEGV
jgi:hypothetical protein